MKIIPFGLRGPSLPASFQLPFHHRLHSGNRHKSMQVDRPFGPVPQHRAGQPNADTGREIASSLPEVTSAGQRMLRAGLVVKKDATILLFSKKLNDSNEGYPPDGDHCPRHRSRLLSDVASDSPSSRCWLQQWSRVCCSWRCGVISMIELAQLACRDRSQILPSRRYRSSMPNWRPNQIFCVQVQPRLYRGRLRFKCRPKRQNHQG
jgi:hypothetical protein